MGFVDDMSLVGLTLTWVISMGNFNLVLLFCSAEVVKFMSSTERIQEYMEDTNFEKDWNSPSLPANVDEKTWPSKGQIEVKDLSIRYRENLP